ncbi:MAG TPA: flagellar biosynthetic protein FliO [Phycisphaerae bacterium]|nr:flagellar biosynthetic protein FliO [Phycisphaerae bacterium]
MSAKTKILAAALLAAMALGGADTSRADAQTAPASAPAAGLEGQTVAPPRDTTGTDLGGGWGRTLAALAIVVGLIFLLRWVLRRMGSPAAARRGPMEVIARTTVSGRQQLLLVRLGERLLVVGSGPEGMTSLGEVRDPAEVAALTRSAEAGRASVVETLKEKFSRRQPSGRDEEKP